MHVQSVKSAAIAALLSGNMSSINRLAPPKAAGRRMSIKPKYYFRMKVEETQKWSKSDLREWDRRRHLSTES